MSRNFKISVGRVRVTRAAHPSEAGYIRSMRMQMDQIKKNLEDAIRKVEGATAESIVYALEPVFELSQEYVPKDTLKLMHSGFVEVDKESRSGVIRAAIGYGKHGVPHYAAFVHERVDIPHAGNTRSKFLEAAVNERIGVFGRRLARRVQELTGLDGG